MVLFAGACEKDHLYEVEEGDANTLEDTLLTRLSTAMVKWVLPSIPSVLLAAQYYWEPSLD